VPPFDGLLLPCGFSADHTDRRGEPRYVRSVSPSRRPLAAEGTPCGIPATTHRREVSFPRPSSHPSRTAVALGADPGDDLNPPGSPAHGQLPATKLCSPRESVRAAAHTLYPSSRSGSDMNVRAVALLGFPLRSFLHHDPGSGQLRAPRDFRPARPESSRPAPNDGERRFVPEA